MYLSKLQREALKKPCPLCGARLRTVGDLGDFEHDIVTCVNDDSLTNYCDYAMFFDGSTMDTDAPEEVEDSIVKESRDAARFDLLGRPRG